MMIEDWRPLTTELINANKIIFTLDDQYIAYDIRGDNKLITFEWPDLDKNNKEVIDSRQLAQKIKNFRDANNKVLEGLKAKLY